MANSFSFAGDDLSVYGLIVTTSRANVIEQLVSYVQLKDRSYSLGIKKLPRLISVGVSIIGSTRAELDSNLNNIKKIIATEADGQLILDILSSRYYMARLTRFDGQYRAAILFEGSIDFICVDPLGYSTTLIERNHDINASPKTVVEAVTGTGFINPVYVLTAREDLGAITLKLENLTTDEELQWTGTLDTDDYLTVDVANWIVRKGVTVSMATVTGQFPRLKPGNNSLKVTALYSAVAGDLDITYRNTFL